MLSLVEREECRQEAYEVVVSNQNVAERAELEVVNVTLEVQ